jgi:hypothetical protein
MQAFKGRKFWIAWICFVFLWEHKECHAPNGLKSVFDDAFLFLSVQLVLEDLLMLDCNRIRWALLIEWGTVGIKLDVELLVS